MFNDKVFYISIIGVLTLGLSGCGCLGGCLGSCLPGCGCLFPSTPNPNTLENLYVELYSEAEDLLYDGEYRAAVEKYEQAFKIRPRRTKVIGVNYISLFKYRIAFCYAKLAEAEGDVSLYIKAEAAVQESYQTAIFPYDQAHILYLWGYILFKQARYEEARAKFEMLTQREIDDRMMWEVLYGLGKAYMELGDEIAARRVLAQLLEAIGVIGHDLLYRLGKSYMELGDEATARRIFAQLEARDYSRYDVGYRLGKSYRYRLGKAYMQLGDEAAARRVLAQLEVEINAALQKGSPYIADELYRLGHAYMELGDEAAARRTFTQLLEHSPNSSYKAEIERLLEKL